MVSGLVHFLRRSIATKAMFWWIERREDRAVRSATKSFWIPVIRFSDSSSRRLARLRSRGVVG